MDDIIYMYPIIMIDCDNHIAIHTLLVLIKNVKIKLNKILRKILNRRFIFTPYPS